MRLSTVVSVQSTRVRTRASEVQKRVDNASLLTVSGRICGQMLRITSARHCDACQTNKASTKADVGKLQPLSIPGRRWEHITLDLIVKLFKTDRNVLRLCVRLLLRALNLFLSWLVITVSLILRSMHS